MRVTGLGFRRGVSAESLRAAIGLVGLGEALATAEDKMREPGLVRLAQDLGLRILGVPRHALQAQGVEGSARVMAAYGTGSVAEAAALAAAGPGARLVQPKRSGPDGMAVAALAETWAQGGQA
ncbi:MAG: cobalamin biosynthesis protein [Pseudomonadota bacterium]